MKRLLLFTLLLPSLAQAKPARYPFSRALCKQGTKRFEVKLESIYKSGDPDDDSEGAQFISIGGREAEMRQGKNLTDGSYTFVKPLTGSLCDKTAAFALSETLLAVLYQADNRPFQEVLHVAFFDLGKKKVTQVENNLGPLGEVIATKEGFAFSNVIARSDADFVKHKSPWGKELSGSDQDLGAYRRVSLEGDKVKIAFDPALSYKESDWKDFYATENEFLEDAGWDAASGKFTNNVVYVTAYFNRKEGPEEQKCIAMTKARGVAIADDKWRCRKIQH
jgi:hypothetical protein